MTALARAAAVPDDLAEHVAVRVAAIDWARVAGELDAQGAAIGVQLHAEPSLRDHVAAELRKGFGR